MLKCVLRSGQHTLVKITWYQELYNMHHTIGFAILSPASMMREYNSSSSYANHENRVDWYRGKINKRGPSPRMSQWDHWFAENGCSASSQCHQGMYHSGSWQYIKYWQVMSNPVLQTWDVAQVRICELLLAGNCKASCYSEGADQHRACTCSRILGSRSCGVWVGISRMGSSACKDSHL